MPATVYSAEPAPVSTHAVTHVELTRVRRCAVDDDLVPGRARVRQRAGTGSRLALSCQAGAVGTARSRPSSSRRPSRPTSSARCPRSIGAGGSQRRRPCGCWSTTWALLSFRVLDIFSEILFIDGCCSCARPTSTPGVGLAAADAVEGLGHGVGEDHGCRTTKPTPRTTARPVRVKRAYCGPRPCLEQGIPAHADRPRAASCRSNTDSAVGSWISSGDAAVGQEHHAVGVGRLAQPGRG